VPAINDQRLRGADYEIVKIAAHLESTGLFDAALRQPPSYNLAGGLPLRQQTHDYPLCIEADRVARNDHKLVGERPCGASGSGRWTCEML
jgi:hypothetical protein